MVRYWTIIFSFLIAFSFTKAEAKNPPPGTGTTDIPANIFAGYFHDHIFVPNNMAKKALEIISSIGDS